ncbi:MAG: DOMON domain-containing protein [Cyclobacteriaceae bacterium]
MTLLLLFMINNEKKLETEGFKLIWQFVDDKVSFRLSAPTNGWVALGFTHGTGIVNSNLIQGAVIDDEVIVQDQYVTGFGEHPPVEALAVASCISEIQGIEAAGITTISFSILKQARDKLHYNLTEGVEINIWLAYSVSDDFSHHSMKRILRTVKL